MLWYFVCVCLLLKKILNVECTLTFSLFPSRLKISHQSPIILAAGSHLFKGKSNIHRGSTSVEFKYVSDLSKFKKCLKKN